MDYVTYNANYIKGQLSLLERKENLTSRDILSIKTLMEIIEENELDEFTALKEKVSLYDGVKRLQALLDKAGEKPIKVASVPSSHHVYGGKKIKLDDYLDSLSSLEGKDSEKSNPLFTDLISFSTEVMNRSKEDTSVVFLLRDALLPYLAIRKWKGNEDVYPLPLGRKLLRLYSKSDDDSVYDQLHNMIFDELVSHPSDSGAFYSSLLPKIKELLVAEVPGLYGYLSNYLGSIKTKKILVVESGYIGTMPLALKAIDGRVDFLLFTTVPYLYDVYQGKYFSEEFYKLREFETLHCTDALFQIADKDFSLVENVSLPNRQEGYKEIREWLFRITVAA
ncbi:MAG: hypothetical protein LKF75_02930 [Bacilli bacterium]|jgi:hypothetical protein|nr:hypothetical protein [Bacilli bacterium]MCI2054732.1 hypothetical protein [Bacilli bacterium]